MHKRTVLLYFLLAIANVAFSQYGKVYDDMSLESEILGMEKKYSIYLPPDYEVSNRSYPILYLLHGLGDDHTGWVQFGEVKGIADRAIENGSATPMIIIMPNAKQDRSGYFNWIREDDWNFENFFFEELMPHVEETYRIRKDKRYRAIAGLSMGGGGTFLYAMHHPELFGAACPLSAWFWWSEFDEFKEKFAKDDLSVGDEKLLAYYKRNHPLELINSVSSEDLNTIKWYIDCGDGDFCSEGNSLMHIAMRKAKIGHEYRVRDGSHNWSYWRESLPSVLHFVSNSFHK
ncbi:alpha/beta hydrolase-fold protein [Arenibacter sp. M-2]|uniref:alpha/beta hydrolase n=1 Tax=Arenibacter sp. M-2 TaxID=3053612 RepID=UPI002570FF91|nr:alpha/beta hydrolase-fold protein [Arenibacter sp. M-2]MDL5511194.1 alpha/beta hydrolase-fold protein [Arenibacter sp. M-2]